MSPPADEGFLDLPVESIERQKAVGLWYENFDQTSDEEVHAALQARAAE